VEESAYIGSAAASLAYFVLGARLVRLSIRTGSAAEWLLGLTFLIWTLSYTLWVIAIALQGQPALESQLLITSRLAPEGWVPSGREIPRASSRLQTSGGGSSGSARSHPRSGSEPRGSTITARHAPAFGWVSANRSWATDICFGGSRGCSGPCWILWSSANSSNSGPPSPGQPLWTVSLDSAKSPRSQ